MPLTTYDSAIIDALNSGELRSPQIRRRVLIAHPNASVNNISARIHQMAAAGAVNRRRERSTFYYSLRKDETTTR